MSQIRPSWPKRIQTLLLHNPTSGDGNPPAEQLIAEACGAGLAVSYRSTKDEDFKAALRERWNLVIIAGGDGTVAKVVRRLRYRKTPLAILPIGTANNIARSMGIRERHPISSFLHASIRKLSVARARGPWGDLRFAESVGIGAIAETISESTKRPPKPFRVSVGRDELARYVETAEPFQVEIAVDGEIFVGKFLLVEVLNLSLSGPALAIAFSAVPHDRMVDVVFLSENEREHMLEWLKRDPDKTPPPVAVQKGSKVTLSWEDRPLRVDDRVYLHPGSPTKVKIRFEPQSLKILVPAFNAPEAGQGS